MKRLGILVVLTLAIASPAPAAPLCAEVRLSPADPSSASCEIMTVRAGAIAVMEAAAIGGDDISVTIELKRNGTTVLLATSTGDNFAVANYPGPGDLGGPALSAGTYTCKLTTDGPVSAAVFSCSVL